MGRYRKKPVVVEAFQFPGKDESQWPDWAKNHPDILYSVYDNELLIRTLEGYHVAKLGHYIVRGVKGELYPVKPEIFEETYEPL